MMHEARSFVARGRFMRPTKLREVFEHQHVVSVFWYERALIGELPEP
jgi:hypothetical protein